MKNKNTLYPVFVKIEKLNVLIIGGGSVALEKVGNILKSSPSTNVILISKEFHYEIVELSHFFSNISLIQKPYHKSDLEDTDMLIAATNDRPLNEQIKEDAKKLNILTNVADDPELCDFYLGSVVTKGPLKLGISTNGQSPTLAKKMRMYFEDVIPDEVEFSAELLNSVRKKIKSDLRHKISTLNTVTSVLNAKAEYKVDYKSDKFVKTNFDIYLN